MNTRNIKFKSLKTDTLRDCIEALCLCPCLKEDEGFYICADMLEELNTREQIYEGGLFI